MTDEGLSIDLDSCSDISRQAEVEWYRPLEISSVGTAHWLAELLMALQIAHHCSQEVSGSSTPSSIANIVKTSFIHPQAREHHDERKTRNYSTSCDRAEPRIGKVADWGRIELAPGSLGKPPDCVSSVSPSIALIRARRELR